MKNGGERIYLPISNVYLIQPRKKNHVIYLFAALATLLSFIPLLLPGVSNCQSFSMSSTLLGALRAAPFSFPSPLLKLGKWQVPTLCPETIQCYSVRGLPGFSKKCNLKAKRRILEISSDYVIPVISWKSTSFSGDTLVVPAPSSCACAGCAEPLALMIAWHESEVYIV